MEPAAVDEHRGEPRDYLTLNGKAILDYSPGHLPRYQTVLLNEGSESITEGQFMGENRNVYGNDQVVGEGEFLRLDVVSKRDHRLLRNGPSKGPSTVEIDILEGPFTVDVFMAGGDRVFASVLY